MFQTTALNKTINMKKRIKKLDLEEIPIVLEKITSVINAQVETLSSKEELSSDDCKNLIAFANCMREVYRDYREQVSQIKKELKEKSKEEILQLVKMDSK